jgi:hypothetical protein
MNIDARLRRATVGLLAVAAAAVMISGCTQQRVEQPTPGRTSSVDPDAAKQQMIDAVQETTERLGGDWEARTGPDYAEECQLPDGGQGAKWRYLVTRGAAGDVAADVAATEARWKAQGMSIDRWGTADRPTIVGRGGGVTESIRLTVADGQYAVQGVSLCFPGDADDL